MPEKYIYNGQIVQKSDVEDAAKQSNLDVNSYLQKSGIKVVNDNYSFNGKTVSAEDVLSAANQSKIGFDDYIQKAKITAIPDVEKKNQVGNVFTNGSPNGVSLSGTNTSDILNVDRTLQASPPPDVTRNPYAGVLAATQNADEDKRKTIYNEAVGNKNVQPLIDFVNQEKQNLQQKKQQYQTSQPAPETDLSGANDLILATQVPTPDNTFKDADEYIKKIQKDASSAMDAVMADKFEASPDKSAEVQNSFGEELRKQKALIGEDINYTDQQEIANAKKVIPSSISSNGIPIPSINPISDMLGIYGAAKENNIIETTGQRFEYTNRGTLLGAVFKEQKEKRDNLMELPDVQAFINGTPEERKALQNNPNVIEAFKASQDVIKTVEQSNNLINQYPQVKAEQQSRQVAELYADYIKMAKQGKFGNEEMRSALNQFTPGVGLFIGKSLKSDQEIKRVSELSQTTDTPLTEEEVRKYADDAKIPSYLGLAVRGFGGVLQETAQGLNRLVLSKEEADLQNKLIESEKYQLPEALQLSTKNVNPDTILSTMFTTTGQIAAYGLEGYLGGEALGLGAKVIGAGAQGLGAATGLIEAGNLSRADLAAIQLGERILPANKLGDIMVKLGITDTPEEAIGSIVSATDKAKNIGGTYGSMYATAYEPAYQEAARYTDDESKRKEYADSQATATSLAFTVLNPAGLIEKGLANPSSESIAADFLKTGGLPSTKDVIKARLLEIGKTVGIGAGQSLIPVINSEIAKSNIFNYHTSSAEFLKQSADAAMSMAVGILPLGILGAAKIPSSEYSKSLLFEAGMQPDVIKLNIADSYVNGEITREEQNRQISVVNTLQNLVRDVPDKNNEGKELTQSEKNNLVYLQLQHDALVKKKDNASNALKPSYDADIKKHQDAINEIMVGQEPQVTLTEDKIKTGEAIQPKLLAPEEVETKLTTELAPEKVTDATSFVKEMADGDVLPTTYKDEAVKNPLTFLQTVADQALGFTRDSEGNRVKSTDAIDPNVASQYSETVVDYAKNLFPEEAAKSVPEGGGEVRTKPAVIMPSENKPITQPQTKEGVTVIRPEAVPPDEVQPSPSEGDSGTGVRISKGWLDEHYNFQKLFDTKGGAEVATGVMDTIKQRADSKGISVNQQISDEVSQMKNNPLETHPTEHNILTAGAHLLNIDKQMTEAIRTNDAQNIDRLSKQRQDTMEVLRLLGNKAGRNLGLFDLVFKDVTDSEISVARSNVKRILGVTDVPESVEELNKSSLTANEKETVRPFVEKIEQLKKDVADYELKAKKDILNLDEKEVKDAIQKARDEGRKEGMAVGGAKSIKEKKSQQLKNLASDLRKSDEWDKFLKGNKGDVTKMGASFDIGSYKEIVANLLEGIAKVVEAGENVADYLKKAIDKVKDVDKNKLLSDVQMLMSRATLPPKEETINKIKDIANNEGTTLITKDMVEKGLIKDFVYDHIHSDLPAEKVIDEAAKELQQYLPGMSREDLADAFVKRNEFAEEKKTQLENTVRQKTEEVKRITNKEVRLRALEAADEYHAADTKEKRQSLKSEYEKGLDNKLKELNKQKPEPETNTSRLQKAKDAVQARIDAIHQEIADKERKLEKEKLPLHEDVELGRLKEVEKSLSELRDKYLPKEPKEFADEKALKKRRTNLINEISELNDQINAGERKTKNEKVADTEEIKTIKKIRDEKRKLLDEIAPDEERIKKQKEDEAKRLADINAEIDYVKKEGQVYKQAIGNKAKASELLKAAREERDKTYLEKGLRIERNGRQPIKIEREYQDALANIEKDTTLSEEEKTSKKAELKQQHDLDLKGTHQGVLSNLSDDIEDLKKENTKKANDASDRGDKETASKINEVNKALDEISKGINSSGENLEDMANRAYAKIKELLKDENLSKEDKAKLNEIKRDFENNNQLTSDELAAVRLKKQFEREIKTAKGKINSKQYTVLPTTPYDFRRNEVLSHLDAQRKNTTGRLNKLLLAARDKSKTALDRATDVSTKILVSGVQTVGKVAAAGALKPFMDSLVETTAGRLTRFITGSSYTTLGAIKEGFKVLGRFKSESAKKEYIKKVSDEKATALDKLVKAHEGGNEKEIVKAENEFKKADLKNGIATLYNSIEANSMNTFWQYLSRGATDYDESIGKGIKRDIKEYRSWLGKTGYIIDGWIRIHGGLKSGLSARPEMMRSFVSTLQHFQEQGKELTPENIATAQLIAANDYEYGRLTNATKLSSLIARGKYNEKSQTARVATKVIFPVSTIAINLTKRGIDYSTIGAEGWARLAKGAKDGMRLNEVEGKEYDTWVQKVKAGIDRIPLKEKKYINGVISRGLFGTATSLLALWGLSNGTVKYGGTWDDRSKRKIIGADGKRLEPGEWEFFGHRLPHFLNVLVDHTPEFLNTRLAANMYEISKLDKDDHKKAGNQVKAAMTEVENSLPFMTILGLANRPLETVTDRFTRVPLLIDTEKAFDEQQHEKKTIGQRVKANVGLDFLNPKKRK